MLAAGCGAPPRGAPADAAGIDAVLVDAEADAGLDADAALPADPFVELQHMPGLCTTDEWCWESPTPTGNDYLHVRVFAPDNIWLLGEGRTVLQWNGQVWRSHRPPFAPGQELVQEPWPYGIDGHNANDMWLIFGSTLQHWNGSSWTIVDVGSFTVIYYNALWVAPNGDVYTAGATGLRRSINGAAGEPVSVPGATTGLTGVWGTDTNDLFVAALGVIYHYDGTQWTEVYSAGGGTSWFQGTKNDAWSSGSSNTLLHWDGAAWTAVPTGLSAGATIDPAGWRSTDDAWWLGGNAFIHWDGTQLTTTPIDQSTVSAGVGSVALDGDRWWMVGGMGSVQTRIGTDALGPIIQAPYWGYSMWGTSDNDMYFAGGGLVHWDGTQQTSIPVDLDSMSGVAGAGVGGANELFGIEVDEDQSTMPTTYISSGQHFDGVTWTESELDRAQGADVAPMSIYAIAPGEAMIVGGHGLAFYHHSGAWLPISTGVTVNLMGVWGPDADHLWITGQQGTLLRWDRANPTVMTPDTSFPATTDDLKGVHGAGGNLWIVHDVTTLVSRRATDGSWSLVNTTCGGQAVFAVSATNVVVTCPDVYRISRWNGTEFVIENHGANWSMNVPFQPPGGHMWLRGIAGLLRHP